MKRLLARVDSARIAVAGAVAAVVMMLSICGVVLYVSRVDAFEHAADSARNTLLVVQRDISRNVELYDLSLQAVQAGLKRPDVMTLPAVLQRGFLFDTAASAQYLGALYVINAKGDVVMNSRSTTSPPLNFGDRDYFQVQRDNPNAGLYISHPFLSRARHGDPSIGLSRRITNPDGSFGGIVLLAVRLSYFQKLLSGLQLGAHGSMALIHADGTLIMRVPYKAALIGRPLKGTGPYTKMSQRAAGSFTDVASIDGVRRYYQFEWLHGLPLIIETASAERDIYADWRKRAIWLCAPMLVFCAAFVSLAFLFAQALTRKTRAESALMMLARVDSLTGLYNRRTLDETLTREWGVAKRTRRPLSILFVDIDHFKRFNDSYGHLAGDEALAAVAKCIAAHIRRAGDMAARYGGEEFVIVLPGTSRPHAIAYAETVRRAASQLTLNHDGVAGGNGPSNISVSIGVATWDGRPERTVAALMKAADEALYQAKTAGRNMVHGVAVI
jgi:diguanylate cyclase (GGDEF)-like protein